MPMAKILTQGQIDQFREQGFVSPIRVMSAAEASGYRRRLERFERETGGPLGGHRSGTSRIWCLLGSQISSAIRVFSTRSTIFTAQTSSVGRQISLLRRRRARPSSPGTRIQLIRA